MTAKIVIILLNTKQKQIFLKVLRLAFMLFANLMKKTIAYETILEKIA